jgi:hypothetical protein
MTVYRLVHSRTLDAIRVGLTHDQAADHAQALHPRLYRILRYR